jgi:hypothetical protein
MLLLGILTPSPMMPQPMAETIWVAESITRKQQLARAPPFTASMEAHLVQASVAHVSKHGLLFLPPLLAMILPLPCSLVLSATSLPLLLFPLVQ